MLARFGIYAYLCQCVKMMVDHPAGRTSDAQLAQPGIFLCQQGFPIRKNKLQRLPFRKKRLPYG